VIVSPVNRPILRYHGGKWRLAPWVISHFPRHKLYVEPFGGGASVLLRKAKSPGEIYNDMDGDIVRFFRTLRDPKKSASLRQALDMTPFARDEYLAAYEPLSDDDVEAARQIMVRSFMGMSSKGLFQRSGFDARVQADGYISRVHSFKGASAVIPAVCNRLSRVVIENMDGLRLIELYDSPETLFYVDPPYLLSTRTGKYYKYEMDDSQHVALINLLQRCVGMVVLSGYANPVYESLTGWARVETEAWVDNGKARMESLWLSPNIARHPQLFSYLETE